MKNGFNFSYSWNLHFPLTIFTVYLNPESIVLSCYRNGEKGDKVTDKVCYNLAISFLTKGGQKIRDIYEDQLPSVVSLARGHILWFSISHQTPSTALQSNIFTCFTHHSLLSSSNHIRPSPLYIAYQNCPNHTLQALHFPLIHSSFQLYSNRPSSLPLLIFSPNTIHLRPSSVI